MFYLALSSPPYNLDLTYSRHILPNYKGEHGSRNELNLLIMKLYHSFFPESIYTKKCLPTFSLIKTMHVHKALKCLAVE
jgi:hypothetical protein